MMMTCDFIKLSNAGVQTLAPYQPGKPISEVQREYGIDDVVKLASNENPLGCSPKARQAAIAAFESIHLYPDGSGYLLKQKLAEHLTLPPTHITLGNGSDSLLSMLIQAYANPDKHILVGQYAFINYSIIAKAHGVSSQVIPALEWNLDIEAMARAVTEKTAIIFIANPNNPTGTYITHQQLAYLLEQIPQHVLVVADEAYIEYVSQADFPNTLALQRQYSNLVITRTFSKAYALAGLRIGYCLSHPQIADILNRVRLPFNVSSPGLAAACAALDDHEHLANSIKLNESGKQELTGALQALNLKVIPSAANFVTVDMGKDTAELFEKLLQRGIILRSLHPYHMPNHFRMTVGLPQQNQQLIDTLTSLLEK